MRCLLKGGQWHQHSGEDENDIYTTVASTTDSTRSANWRRAGGIASGKGKPINAPKSENGGSIATSR